VIFDGRNLYDLQKMIDCGYYYNSIGRKVITTSSTEPVFVANGVEQ